MHADLKVLFCETRFAINVDQINNRFVFTIYCTYEKYGQKVFETYYLTLY